MKFSVFILLLSMLAHISYSQDATRVPWMARENRIGLAIGIGSVQYLDKNSSPLVYQSKPKLVQLFYVLESNHWLFSLDIDVKVGGTKAKHFSNRQLLFQEEDYTGKKEEKRFPVGGSFLAGKISMGGFYKISSTQRSTFRVAVGGRISNEMFYPQGWTSGGIFNALSLSPEGWAQHRVNDEHSFTANFHLPLLTKLTRLPYYNTVSAPDKSLSGGFFSNSKWVGVGKYLAPSTQINYNYAINANWGAGVYYELTWYNIIPPQLMRATSHGLLVNTYHQF